MKLKLTYDKKYHMTQNIIGWDIGGAHLKAVLLDVTGRVLGAKQVYCPLWRGLHELEQAIDAVMLDFNAPLHVVTMTGELADIFANRREGVLEIAKTLALKINVQRKLESKIKLKSKIKLEGKTKPERQIKLTEQLRYYVGYRDVGANNFVYADRLEQRALDVASMNWLASVQCVAQTLPHVLFIDIGSTTTDIALIINGKPQVEGFTDARRMQLDELVYTGVVRTPLMALTQKIQFANNVTNVAAELFATTADVYTLTGDLAQVDNMAETTDGAEKSVEASAKRVARMIGHDAQDAPLSSWRQLASTFKNIQINQIKQAVLNQLTTLEDYSSLCVVGAGVGSFLVAEIARQLALNYVDVRDLIIADDKQVKDMTAACFPAYAVAFLGLNEVGIEREPITA